MIKKLDFIPELHVLIYGSQGDDKVKHLISSLLPDLRFPIDLCDPEHFPESVLKKFSDGADGIIIIRANNDEPTNKWFENRIKILGRLLHYMGVEPGRLRVERISPSDGGQLVPLIADFMTKLHEFGETPLRSDIRTEYKTAAREPPLPETENEDARVSGMRFEALELARSLMLSGTIDTVLGMIFEHGQVLPAQIDDLDELDRLVLHPVYNLGPVIRKILEHDQDKRYGVMVYPCDERALNDLERRGSIDMDRIELIKLTCTEAQGMDCRCEMSYPGSVSIEERIRYLINGGLRARYEFWAYQFSKCIKCYGCRDICPTVTGDLGILEDNRWVTRGKIPPALSFHLIRLYHMADKCIGCGECEAACPVDIPLATLQHQLIRDMRKLFGYESGFEQIKRSPLDKESDRGFAAGGDR